MSKKKKWEVQDEEVISRVKYVKKENISTYSTNHGGGMSLLAQISKNGMEKPPKKKANFKGEFGKGKEVKEWTEDDEVKEQKEIESRTPLKTFLMFFKIKKKKKVKKENNEGVVEEVSEEEGDYSLEEEDKKKRNNFFNEMEQKKKKVG